jgi:hypothetical protein
MLFTQNTALKIKYNFKHTLKPREIISCTIILLKEVACLKGLNPTSRVTLVCKI